MPQGLEEGKCSYQGRSLQSRDDRAEKSAEAIVVVGKRAITDKWRPHGYNEGLNVKLFQMLQGGNSPALH